jgi:preprotein translocase subunit SecD
MRRSESWRLAITVLVVLAALFVALSADHPAWAESLLFWQPAGQRDIVLHTGLDLQGNLQVLLTSDLPEGQELNADTLEAARRIVENRASDLELTKPVVRVQNERHIVVQLPGIRERHQLTDTLQALGLVEFVNAGLAPPQPGAIVETTLDRPYVEEPTTPLTPTTPTTPTTSGRVLETVVSSDDLAFIAPRRTGENAYMLDFLLAREATAAFDAYAAVHGGQFLAVALDKKIIGGASLPDPSSGQDRLVTQDDQGNPRPLQVSAYYLTDENATSISALLRYGPLPVPLRVEKLEPIGPTLGETVIQRSGRAVTIGLIAVLVFLPLHYRLLGLPADLALLIFTVLNFALCKVIPLPLTLPSVTGFAVAALATLGAHLTVIERLRGEMRAGQHLSLSRAIDTSFSNTWPSIRDIHLALLLISIAMWSAGATYAIDSIQWMGVTLLTGVLTSFFVTMVVTRPLIHLTLGAARESLSERKWLLGI